jgi:hypothetical protein
MLVYALAFFIEGIIAATQDAKFQGLLFRLF